MNKERKPFPLFGHFHVGWGVFWVFMILLANALALGLSDAIRGVETTWLALFGVISMITGWSLGGVYKKKVLVFSIGETTGILLLILIYSGSAISLFRALIEAFKIFTSQFPFQSSIPEWGLFFYYLYELAGNFNSYIFEIFVWSASIFQTQSAFNPLVVNFIWSSLTWIALFASGWMLRRKAHVFIATLPVIALLTGVLGYTRQKSPGLIIALGSTLFLIVLFEHIKREAHWESQRIDYSEELRFDIATLAIPVILIILSIAYVIPNVPFSEIGDIYRDFFRINRENQFDFAETFGLEQVPIDSLPSSSSNGMPRSHLITAGDELSDILVMEIDTGETFFPPEVDPTSTLPKYYWFGRSYDIYTGTGWKSSDISIDIVPANELVQIFDITHFRTITQTNHKTSSASTTLYSAGIPQSISHDTRVGWRVSTGEYYSAELDVSKYQVQVPVLNLSKDRLSEENLTPPLEILEVYLSIPENVPDRVHNLAASLVAESTTPYEKATAIEAYLRQFDYTLDLPLPPDDRDIVDYFLFDLQRGYCDYYASAMVILARASGLPARLAVGYSTGNYDYTHQMFIITEANAHAWPEIYIAPFGWVPFEPTGSLNTFLWITETDDYPSFSEHLLDKEQDSLQPSIWINLLGFSALLLIIMLIGFLWYWIAYRKYRPLSTTLQIEQLYQRMRTHLSKLFFSPKINRTPQELQTDLINYFDERASTRINERLFTRLSKDFDALIATYQQGVYGPLPLTIDQVKKARQTLNSLRLRSLILRVMFIFIR